MEEYTVELNLDNNGRQEFITPKITGKLLAVIIESPEPTNINLVVEEINMILFRILNFSGTNYFVPKIQPINYNNEYFSFATEHWELNNRLILNVGGKKNSRVKFIFRYSNEEKEKEKNKILEK